jgi:hypothetical protein
MRLAGPQLDSDFSRNWWGEAPDLPQMEIGAVALLESMADNTEGSPSRGPAFTDAHDEPEP